MAKYICETGWGTSKPKIKKTKKTKSKKSKKGKKSKRDKHYSLEEYGELDYAPWETSRGRKVPRSVLD